MDYSLPTKPQNSGSLYPVKFSPAAPGHLAPLQQLPGGRNASQVQQKDASLYERSAPGGPGYQSLRGLEPGPVNLAVNKQERQSLDQVVQQPSSGTLVASASPVKSYRGPVTEAQKTKMYTNQLLVFKIQVHRLEIEAILDACLQKPLLDAIDCRKHFDSIITDFLQKTKLSICKNTDFRRQQYRKSDKQCIKHLKEFFFAIFKDNHGQSFFSKQEFFDGIKRFFVEQDKIFKKMKDLTGDFIILLDKSMDFEEFNAKGESFIKNGLNNSLQEQQDDPTDILIQNLENSMANCKKLLQSGQIKDFNRKESLQQMIKQFASQITQLQKQQLLHQETKLKHQISKQSHTYSQKDSSSPLKDQTTASLLTTSNNDPLLRSSLDSSHPLKKKNIAPGAGGTTTRQKRALGSKVAGTAVGKPAVDIKADVIDHSVREIFDFYAKQHIANNQGFSELQEGMKKIDIGEFNGFLRDFKINLPRQKTQDIFLKAGNNQREIELEHFKKSIVMIGTEYAQAKLRENTERLKEWDKLIGDLQIPKSYTNNAGTKEYKEQLLKTLNAKMDRFQKYIDNNLRQRMSMADQMPVKRGHMVIKKKATTITGAKLRLSIPNQEALKSLGEKKKEDDAGKVETADIKKEQKKDDLNGENGEGEIEEKAYQKEEKVNENDDRKDEEDGKKHEEGDRGEKQEKGQIEEKGEKEQNDQDYNQKKDQVDTGKKQEQPDQKVQELSLNVLQNQKKDKKAEIEQQSKKDVIDPYLIKIDNMDQLRFETNQQKYLLIQQIDDLQSKINGLVQDIELKKAVKEQKLDEIETLREQKYQKQVAKEEEQRLKFERKQKKKEEAVERRIQREQKKEQKKEERKKEREGKVHTIESKQKEKEEYNANREAKIAQKEQKKIEREQRRKERQERNEKKQEQKDQDDDKDDQENAEKDDSKKKEETEEQSEEEPDSPPFDDTELNQLLKDLEQFDLLVTAEEAGEGSERDAESEQGESEGIDGQEYSDGENEQSLIKELEEEVEGLEVEGEEEELEVVRWEKELRGLERKVAVFDEEISHPIHDKIEEVRREHELLEKVLENKNFEQYSFEDLCSLHIKDSYRKKIKGFHMAFNVKEKLDENSKSKYQYQVTGSAEELRLHALDRKNQRLYRKQMEEQYKEEKYQRDRQKLKMIAEQIRRQRQQEVNEGAVGLGGQKQNRHSKQAPYQSSIVSGNSPTKKIESISMDRLNQGAKGPKGTLGGSITRVNSLRNKHDTMIPGIQQIPPGPQGNPQALLPPIQQPLVPAGVSDSERRVQEVQEVLMKPTLNFSDLEKLSYSDLNAISVRLGEEAFDPKTFMGYSEDQDLNEHSNDTTDIRSRFKKPAIGQQRQQNLPLGQLGDIVSDFKTPTHFHAKKLSKPSNYSYGDSSQSNIIKNRLWDQTGGSNEMHLMPSTSPYPQSMPEYPGSIINQIAASADQYAANSQIMPYSAHQIQNSSSNILRQSKDKRLGAINVQQSLGNAANFDYGTASASARQSFKQRNGIGKKTPQTMHHRHSRSMVDPQVDSQNHHQTGVEQIGQAAPYPVSQLDINNRASQDNLKLLKQNQPANYPSSEMVKAVGSRKLQQNSVNKKYSSLKREKHSSRKPPMPGTTPLKYKSNKIQVAQQAQKPLGIAEQGDIPQQQQQHPLPESQQPMLALPSTDPNQLYNPGMPLQSELPVGPHKSHNYKQMSSPYQSVEYPPRLNRNMMGGAGSGGYYNSIPQAPGAYIPSPDLAKTPNMMHHQALQPFSGIPQVSPSDPNFYTSAVSPRNSDILQQQMKNQNQLRVDQINQAQSSKNSKMKLQMDGYLKQHDRNINKGIKIAKK